VKGNLQGCGRRQAVPQFSVAGQRSADAADAEVFVEDGKD
jgi:hypothetical protein